MSIVQMLVIFFGGGGEGEGGNLDTLKNKSNSETCTVFLHIYGVFLSPRVPTAAADTVDDNGGG